MSRPRTRLSGLWRPGFPAFWVCEQLLDVPRSYLYLARTPEQEYPKFVKSVVSDISSEPIYDERGVDRTLIREMLVLEPEERLRHMEAIVEDVLAIWELNGTRPVR